MKKQICVALALLLLGMGGCGEAPVPSAPALSPDAPEAVEKVELTVSAAASLTDCLNEIKKYYEMAVPDVTITCNFGASGALQQQIEQGAPADVFFSAGKKQMQALSDAGLMKDGTVEELLLNKVVLITPKDGTKLTDFVDLTGGNVKRIGVGELKSVPVGQYTQEIFENLELTESLAPKLVMAKDVREVLAWVETGNVDAGVVYETDAMISDKVEISCLAPIDSYAPVVYPVGVTKDSKVSEEAERFVTYLTKNDMARLIFTKYGFAMFQLEPYDCGERVCEIE